MRYRRALPRAQFVHRLSHRGYRCCRRRLRGRLNVNNATKREETMKPFFRLLALSAATGTLLAPAGRHSRPTPDHW
jgi:hypothetical protein